MMSSISPRWLTKTCGLFDTGFAGDAEQITSIVPTAQTDVLTQFDLGGHDSSLIDFTTSDHLNTSYDNVAQSFTKDLQLESQPTGVDDQSWDLLDDLSADPLGDDSLDAFINLDKYLMGNSFFDEGDNLEPEQEPEEVNPVISIPAFGEELDQVPVDYLQDSYGMVPSMLEMVQCTSFEPTPTPIPEPSVTNEKPSRKRKKKAKSDDSVTTSLYEIPESTKALLKSTVDRKLLGDHDYSVKRQKLNAVSPPVATNSGSSAQASLVSNVEVTDNCVTSSTESTSTPVDKQSQRRIKNNVASKRSREQRKQKFVDMDQEAEELVVRNESLRKKIIELEALAKDMKVKLVAKMTGK